MLALKLIGIIGLSYLLGKVTTQLIKVFNQFSRELSLGKFAVTAIVMALMTSLPEIMVAISSSVKGVTGLALGNALGANIVNLSLVIGSTAIVGRSLHFNNDKSLKQSLAPIAYTLAPFILVADNVISRPDGLILLFIYGFYVRDLLIKGMGSGEGEKNEVSLQAGKVSPMVLKTGVWVGLLVIVSELIVRLAKSAAVDLNLPIIFIGLFLVSVGTTLPELVFNIKAAKKREISMSLGNVIGSCTTNATLIIGLAALIKPISIVNPFSVWLPAVEYGFILVLLIVFTHSKHRLDYWEGIILIMLFAYYSGLAMIIK